MKKKILIIGNSPKGYSLAKKLSQNHDIYVTPSSDTLNEFATCLDIRDDSTNELLEFVMENGIDMTIPVSHKAIDSDITTLFNNNNQQIFAPSSKACEIILNKSTAKKLMYKLRIPTPKFGIFEKLNIANDYIKNQKSPFIIKTNESNSAVIITSSNIAKNVLEIIFNKRNAKAIIEDYIYGTPFSFYAITDGYKALPIGNSLIYKHALEGDGGQLTNGMGACVPNYKLSIEHEYFIMDNVIYPTIEYLESSGNPYVGILGVNGIISDEGKLQFLGWQNFMQDSDCDAILNGIDDDLYNLLEACIIGSFSDEFDNVNINNKSFVSVVISNQNKNNEQNTIKGVDSLDDDILTTFYPTVKKNKYLELEADSNAVMILTSSASSLFKAKERICKELKNIEFKGMKYRKDICKINI